MKRKPYKTYCDYHPNRRAKYAFTDAFSGKRRGLCRDCFEDERYYDNKPRRRNR